MHCRTILHFRNTRRLGNALDTAPHFEPGAGGGTIPPPNGPPKRTPEILFKISLLL